MVSAWALLGYLNLFALGGDDRHGRVLPVNYTSRYARLESKLFHNFVDTFSGPSIS